MSDTIPLVSYDLEKRPAVSNLIDLYCIVTGNTPLYVEERQWNATQLKTELANAIEEKFRPIRERVSQLEKSEEVSCLYCLI